MATAATVVGFVLYYSSGASGTQAAPFSSFAKAALSNTIASPIGCAWEDTCRGNLNSVRPLVRPLP
jgi:hypothetical protein